MQLRFLREGRLLVCSLLWQTVLGADYHDVRLANRQNPGTFIGPVTATVTLVTRFTLTETATVTVTPTDIIILAAITTVMSTEKITTTTTRTTSIAAGETGSSAKRRRQVADAGPLTVTSTTTIWLFPDATETLTITITDLRSALQTSTTITQLTTETSTVTSERIITVSATPFVERPDPLTIGDGAGGGASRTHLAVILGAVFGSLVGAIALFVTGFLWAKKREEMSAAGREELEYPGVRESMTPGGGGGRVTGMLLSLYYIISSIQLNIFFFVGLLGSVLGSTRSSAHYNTIPDAAMFLAASAQSPRQSPPQLPPIDLNPPSDYSFDLRPSPGPKLPALHISPPRHSVFACEYTFGSPVSSISEGRTNTSGGHETAGRGNLPQTPDLLSATFGSFHPVAREGEQSWASDTGEGVGRAVG